jgi:hypothetical protein
VTGTHDVIQDFWQWYNRRAQRQNSGVAKLALDKCEETFQRCDWNGFGYWYEVYCRERGRIANRRLPNASTMLGSRKPLH